MTTHMDLPVVQMDLTEVRAYVETRAVPGGMRQVLVIRDSNSCVELTGGEAAARLGAQRISTAAWTLAVASIGSI